MKVIYNSLLPFPGFVAINLFGVIFIRNGFRGIEPRNTFRHEAIHTTQMKELGYLPFYIIYFFEWLYLLCKYREWEAAYYNVSFEVEAYEHEGEPDYLETRKHYAQWKKK